MPGKRKENSIQSISSQCKDSICAHRSGDEKRYVCTEAMRAIRRAPQTAQYLRCTVQVFSLVKTGKHGGCPDFDCCEKGPNR